MKKIHCHSIFHRNLRHRDPASARLLFGIFASTLLLLALAGISNSAALAAPDAQPSQNGGARLTLTPASSSLVVGNSIVITANLESVTDAYGYQFKVNYDAAKLSAVGAFVNSFIDPTTNAFSPSGWNGTCSSGVCNFGVTLLNPASAVTGTGPVAKITFTGLTPGIVPLTFGSDIIADRNGFPILHTTNTSTLTVFGTATITGTVNLQGRSTPISPGTISLTDNASLFLRTVTNFDQSTGLFTATVPVDLGGSTYKLVAAHSLYLSNQLTGVGIASGGVYNAGTTSLRAGDGTNDGTVDILDLSCVGGRFHLSPAVCGVSGNSDLNADGAVDIFDLVLVGGNFHLSSPQPW